MLSHHQALAPVAGTLCSPELEEGLNHMDGLDVDDVFGLQPEVLKGSSLD